MLLHPEFLWGLSGAAAPVLIHLLARRRARRVLFPSLRLLRAAEKKRRTLARLQQPLSLLLRVLAVCLIALALAAPVVGWLPAWAPLPRTRAVAVLLDDTLSMTAPVVGGAPFERAKSAAEACLAELGPSDRAALVRLSAPGEAQWLRSAEARERLAAMQPTASGARVAPALWRATELFPQIDAPNRAVLVVTDLQAAAWQDPTPSAGGLEATPLLLCDVGEESAANVAVTDVEPLTPGAVIGRPVRLQATVAASLASGHSGKPQKVVLQLLAAGRPVAASEQDVSPRAPVAAQMSFVPAQATDTVVSVGLTGGPWGPGLDDVRYCTVRVRPSLRVVVASVGPAGRYLATALNPFGEAEKTGARVRLVDPSGLGKEVAAGKPDLIVLANCPALDGSATQALAVHANAGGGLLVFLGDGADARHLAEELIPRLTGDRSLRVGPVDRAPPGAPCVLTEIDTARQPLSPFANPRAGDLGAMRFTKARKITVGAQARVLASFDTGSPALIEWRAGQGRLVLLNMSADGSWGEHIRSAAYVPLLHRLASYLARPARPSIPDVLVGERPIAQGADPPAEVALTPPGGPAQVVPVEDGALPEVKVPGEYRVQWGTLALGFAANTDPRESDLTRTTEAAVRRALAPAEVTSVSREATGRQIVAQLPARADLSLPLLVCALAVLLFESIFSIVQRGPEEGLSAPRPRTIPDQP